MPRLRSLLLFFLLVPTLSAQVPALPTDPEEVGALDGQKAFAFFAQFRSQEDLAFHAPHDGCYARCHLMSTRLRQMGVQVRRVWAFPPTKTRLHAKTTRASSGAVEWDWHVAPLVPLRIGDQVEWLVFDPCLFTRPIRMEDWQKAMRKSDAAPMPTLTVTQLGEPPHRNGKRLPGTGYWTQPDPREGPSAHAVKTLKGFGKAPSAKK